MFSMPVSVTHWGRGGGGVSKDGCVALVSLSHHYTWLIVYVTTTKVEKQLIVKFMRTNLGKKEKAKVKNLRVFSSPYPQV